MNKYFQKRLSAFLAASVLATSVVTGFSPVISASELKKESRVALNSDTGEVTVTPVNLLNPRFGDTTNTGLNGWDVYNSVDGGYEKVGPMLVDRTGSFANKVVNGRVVATIRGHETGVNFYNTEDKARTIAVQRIHVVKGETYELKFTAQGAQNSTLSDVLYQFGPENGIVNEVVGGDPLYKTVRYTAKETGETSVILGATMSYYSWVGASFINVDITDVSVKNIDVTAPSVPVVSQPIFTDKNLVIGKAEPNTIIIATTEKGEEVLGEVDNEGNYSLQLPRQVAGNLITVRNRDIAGNISASVAVTVRQGDLSAPIVKQVTTESDTITGTADLNVSVIAKVIKPDLAEKLYSGTTDDKGNYSIRIARPEFGDKVEVLTSTPGKISPPTVVNVVDTVQPEAPVVDPLTTDSTTVTGKGDPSNTIKVKLEDGTEITGEIKSDHTFAVDIPAQLEGAKVTVVQVKKSGFEGLENVVTVGKGSLESPIVDELTDQTTRITGTAIANAELKISIKDEEDKIVKQYDGTVDSAGKFVLLVDQLKSNYTVEITQTIDGRVSRPLIVSVKDTIAPTIPTVDKVTSDDTDLKGQAEALATVEAYVGENLIGSAKAGKDGNYTLSIAKQTEGTNIKLVAIDAAGNKSEEASVIVAKSTKFDLTVNEYKLGNEQITGTFGKGISRVRLFVNGVVKAQATTNSKGEYVLNNVNKFILKAEDKVEIVGVNAKFAEVARTDVKVEGQKVDLITVNNYTLTEKTLEGTFKEGVSRVRLFVNGVVKTQAVTDNATGKYVFHNMSSFVLDKNDKVEVVAVNSQFQEIERKSVNIVGKSSNGITADEYTIGGKTITGTFESSVARVRLSVDGEIKAQATTDSATGKYVINNADKLIVSASSKIEIVAVDSQFREINRISVSVAEGLMNLIQQDKYAAGDKELTGTVGENISRIRLFVNGVVKAQGQIDSLTKKFAFDNVDKLITSSTDKVELVAVDKGFREVNRITVNVTADGPLTILTADSDYVVGSETLTGVYGTLGSRVRLFVNGIVKVQADTKDGKFSFNGLVAKAKIKEGDRVELVLVNAQFQEINRVSVAVIPKSIDAE
ncbi:autolysin modifier protein [Listeria rocourtiae]|uniref:immunoglobulin-like domain-containing protein n=1 Tax=Listeria rocourtiae TaxID=647910 RepID=UPI0016293A05|nr:immunoglobulin-like domain-containing protein [Listeria rocourtiae]MBC1605360.1 autolysin modifier protein [Listeria rocourtiae]